MNINKINGLAINKIFTQDDLRTGFHAYHHGVLPKNKLVKPSDCKFNLGIELEVCFPNESSREAFCNVPSNWYKCEKDSSLDAWGCEIITLPMPWKEAIKPKTWAPLMKLLLHFGAKSWNKRCCGLHVHASALGLMADTDIPSFINKTGVFIGTTNGAAFNESSAEHSIGLRQFNSNLDKRKAEAQFLYKLCLDGYGWVASIFGRPFNSNYAEGWANHTADHIKALALSDIPNNVKTRGADECCWSRYKALNITNAATIEFRHGKGSIKAERIASICMLCAGFMRFAATKLQANKLRVKEGEFLETMKKTNKNHPLYAMLNGVEEN